MCESCQAGPCQDGLGPDSESQLRHPEMLAKIELPACSAKRLHRARCVVRGGGGGGVWQWRCSGIGEARTARG